MKNSKVTLPIFPLPVFLLPEGITRLRIFEPRYLKMITIATKEQGFVIWLNTNESQLPHSKWGSWVNIINFNQGKDGVLEIDVKCKALVNILAIDKDTDNLHFGQVCEVSHWSQGDAQPSVYALSNAIEHVFENDTMLSELYSEKQTDNINWVIARWLELLPVNFSIKNSFVDQHGFEDAKNFVQSIIGK